MRLWRGRPAGDRPGNAGEGDLVSRIMGEIRRVRRGGEPPDRDAGSFARFTCDLCHGSHPMRELRQCVLCGRWACAPCFTEKYYACKACNGIITLYSTMAKGEK